jgi:hypothetical protein
MSGGGQELCEFVLAHEAVMKNHASVNAEMPASRLEHQPICLTFTLDDMRMRGTEHDVDRLGMSPENLRESIDDLLDALVW